MAVKTYSYKKDGDTYLSKHFQVKEFGSFSGSKLYTDTVLIDSDLVAKLEELFEFVNASKAIINSGYRCATHDKAVGGSGTGQHVNGKAVDIVYYDQSGNVISTKYICCIASELGFNGIANISYKYCATHLDVRSGSKYWGDEIYNYSSIWYRNSKWTDFYKYWNLDRNEVLAKFNKTSSDNTTTESDVNITQPEVEFKAKVINGNWNVRKTPVTGRIITTLKENTLVTYTKTQNISNSGTWYYLNEYSGWISGSGLTTTNVTNTTVPTKLIIASGTWNVRKAINSGAIITTVKGGEQYEFTDTKLGSTTWYKIKINNTTGWLSGKGVSKIF